MSPANEVSKVSPALATFAAARNAGLPPLAIDLTEAVVVAPPGPACWSRSPSRPVPAMPCEDTSRGYRPKTNSYSGWDLPQWERYLRDLVIFGCNAIDRIRLPARLAHTRAMILESASI